MSESFDQLIEQRRRQIQEREKQSGWMWKGLLLIAAIVVLVIWLRPDPSTAPVDVNRATAEQLTTLPGIGPSTAQSIIRGRPYTKPEDLLKVKGIGEATLRKMQPRLKFDH